MSSSIYQKIVAVYNEVTYIQKDKRNSFHGYSYASEAAIKEKLHESFAKHGLVMLPPDVLEVQDVEKVNEKGKKSILTTIKVKFGIGDQDSGEAVYGTIFARGVDGEDKGIYKAITGGLKYFLTTTFLIPTGDDPEDEEDQPEQKPQRAPKPRQQEPPPPPDDVPPPQQAKQKQPYNHGTAIAAVSAFKDRIGEHDYRRILNELGFERANTIPDRRSMEAVYLKLAAFEKAKAMEAGNAA